VPESEYLKKKKSMDSLWEQANEWVISGFYWPNVGASTFTHKVCKA